MSPTLHGTQNRMHRSRRPSRGQLQRFVLFTTVFRSRPVSRVRPSIQRGRLSPRSIRLSWQFNAATRMLVRCGTPRCKQFGTSKRAAIGDSGDKSSSNISSSISSSFQYPIWPHFRSTLGNRTIELSCTADLRAAAAVHQAHANTPLGHFRCQLQRFVMPTQCDGGMLRAEANFHWREPTRSRYLL